LFPEIKSAHAESCKRGKDHKWRRQASDNPGSSWDSFFIHSDLGLTWQIEVLRRCSPKSRSASATHAAAQASGINSGRAGAISKSDAVAIDMVFISLT